MTKFEFIHLYIIKINGYLVDIVFKYSLSQSSLSSLAQSQTSLLSLTTL